MKILHISMGLPPFRTGGLNRYCSDLMEQQIRNNHIVALLYPGEFTLSKKTSIKREYHPRFLLYRILNPLPLPLTFGINDPERYMKQANRKIFVDFLQAFAPDVIHVHSLQGIHKEFFDVAASMNIRMVYTTHDYFPFCPRCVMMDNHGQLCAGPLPEKCAQCNNGFGLTKKQEVAMQSQFYKRLKYCALFKRIRKIQKESAISRKCSGKLHAADPSAYGKLLVYYASIIQKMNIIHCVSQTAMELYSKCFPDLPYRLLPITHSCIHERVHVSNRDGGLRIGFVGGLSPYKGLSVLLEAMSVLDSRNIRGWRLWLYGDDYGKYDDDPRIHNEGFYTQKQEDKIWDTFDILAVPSQWYETFGFVVEEALAHHVQVVCSDLVGAKMLLPKNAIFAHDSAVSLADCLLNKSPSLAVLPEELFSMQAHADKVMNLLYRE